jgi:hypothetical protein
MSAICSICDADPTSHSFVHLGKEGGTHIFYSCPAVATKYKDSEGIIIHFDKTLEHYQCNREPWKWIFDGYNFELRHTFEIGTAIGLAKLITAKYSTHLLEIHIVNSNWYIRIALNIVLPFLNERIQNIIKFIDAPTHQHLDFGYFD